MAVAPTHLVKLPTMYPEVRVSVPVDDVELPKVNVLLPVITFPFVNVIAEVGFTELVNVTPAVLLMVKLFTVEGNPGPVTCAEVPE